MNDSLLALADALKRLEAELEKQGQGLASVKDDTSGLKESMAGLAGDLARILEALGH